MNLESIDKTLFEPADKVLRQHALSRPSLSYWEDAWRRFKKNKQSLFSLWLVVALILFVMLGPLLWKLSPNDQNLYLPGVGPSWNNPAIAIDSLAPWKDELASSVPATPTKNIENLSAPENIHLLDVPTTLGVRLAWNPVEGASGYVLYRSVYEPHGENLGIPIEEISAGNIVSYQDQSVVEVETYYYSLVAKNLNGKMGPPSKPFIVKVNRVVSLPEAQKLDSKVKPGDSVNLPPIPAGTDSLGRDILARLMYGGRVSLFIGFFSSLAYVFLGILIGGTAGYAGGRVDNILMRFTDFVTGLPFLLFMILIKVTFANSPGESGINTLILALVVLSWTGTARLVRGQILQLRESEYVQAAKLLGASPSYILFRHMVPNLLGVVLVALTFGIPSAIFTEAFLSFIGLGVSSPDTSWGAMCYDGVLTILNHPHIFFFPGVLISLTVLAFNLLGDGLRDALDPKLRSVD